MFLTKIFSKLFKKAPAAAAPADTAARVQSLVSCVGHSVWSHRILRYLAGADICYADTIRNGVDMSRSPKRELNRLSRMGLINCVLPSYTDGTSAWQITGLGRSVLGLLKDVPGAELPGASGSAAPSLELAEARVEQTHLDVEAPLAHGSAHAVGAEPVLELTEKDPEAFRALVAILHRSFAKRKLAEALLTTFPRTALELSTRVFVSVTTNAVTKTLRSMADHGIIVTKTEGAADNLYSSKSAWELTEDGRLAICAVLADPVYAAKQKAKHNVAEHAAQHLRKTAVPLVLTLASSSNADPALCDVHDAEPNKITEQE